MASGSLIFYTAGTILLALGFAAHVAHAVLLANGRRSIAILAPRPAPAYAGAVTGSFVEGRGRSERLGHRPTSAAAPFAWGLTLAAWLAIGLSMLLRAVIVGRGPWGNMFEFTVAFAFTIAGGYLFLERRYPIRSIGFLPIGVALMLLAYSATLPKQIEPLVPALQNAPLLTIHVGMATIAYGIFATSFAAGVGYLVQGVGDRFAWLRYWGWDPKETSALVTWLTYAIYLHARNRRSWAGRPAALFLVVGFGMVLVTYSGSLWFSGLHAYSGLN